MFPGPGAEIHRNEEGEVLGWDYPSYDEPPDLSDYDDWHDNDEEEDDDDG